VSAEKDWTRFGFHGLASEFDSTWSVFGDRLLNPSLDSSAIALTRARFLTEIKGRTESPDQHGAVLAQDLAYRDHPYAIDPNGSEQSVNAITAAGLHEYLSSQMMTSRMLLVVVGDVSRPQVEAAITRTLGAVPRGNYVWALPPALAPTSPGVAAAQRPTPTNYLRGFFAGPQRSSPDYPAFEFAMQALSGWIGSAVRGTGALSYAAGAMVVGDGAAGGQIFVSTTRPDTVMKLINGAIDTLGKIVAFPRWVLTDVANSYSNAYARMQETSAQYADLLARSQLYNGDHRAAARYRAALRKVVPVDLRNAVSKYVRNIQWSYVGDTTRMPRALMLR
jgi:zinc protease